MSDTKEKNPAPADGAPERTLRIAEVVSGGPATVPNSDIRDFREAVVPAACAADAVNISITANKGGEPELSCAPSPPPGVKVIKKDGTD